MNDKDVKFRVYDEWLCTCTWSSELYITTIACYKFVWVYTSQWHLFYLKCNCMCLYLIVIFVTIDFMCALLYMSVLDNFRVPREKPIPKSIDEMPKFEEKEKKVNFTFQKFCGPTQKFLCFVNIFLFLIQQGSKLL